MAQNHSSPLDNEDLLQEILLRLPPKPSSLPRASLVCKRWRCIISDPRFPRRFRKHHRKPLLLGFFDKEISKVPVFTPMLDPPDRIPVALPENLLGREPWGHLCFSFHGCRDGIALFLDHQRHEAILWDPLTSVQRCVAFPSWFLDGIGKDCSIQNATVLCPASDNQHEHGGSHMSPFKLVFAWRDAIARKEFICIYESKSGVWGDIIPTRTAYVISRYRPSILVGNALCWLLEGGNILKFDFGKHTLAVIEKPEDTHAAGCEYVHSSHSSFQILRGEDNGIGLAILSTLELSIQLWVRKFKCDGVFSWVLQNTVQLDELFSRPARIRQLVFMLGYDEDTNVIFLSSDSHDFILQLESMQFNYIGRRKYRSPRESCPYTNFCTAVRSTAGGDGGAENVNT
ncbi:uncharacterized protein LOC124657717 isoform X2 [Lolium rigidum]|uniref:uncharacterized protein LOC124657717 isoform X2 n=1 Tax=Lolium rigidum TaxID=89674 RepID=UPI001F5DF00E|nr:uncharacterized protein LOC124657717 isoform X2 [Lolium rigidum]